MDRSQMVGAVAVATGGCAALLSLTTARQTGGTDALLGDVPVRAPETAVMVGVVVAIVVAALASRAGRRASAATAVLGLICVALTVGSSMQSTLAGTGATVAAGVALGGLIGHAATSSSVAALAAGAVVGATVSAPLRDPLAIVIDGSRPQNAVDTRSVGLVLAIVAIIALMIAVRSAGTGTLAVAPARSLTLVVTLTLTVVAWALAKWPVTVQDSYRGWLLVPAVFAASLALRNRAGMSLLLVALTWAVVTRPADVSWIPDVRWFVLLVPLTALGVLLGRRDGRPEVFVALLIPCVATWLIIDGPLDRTFSFSALFVVPVVVVAAITSDLRRNSAVPEIVAVALTAVALWTTSSPLPVEIFASRVGDGPTIFVRALALPQTLSIAAEYVVPAVLTLVVCVAALWTVRRRAHDA